MKVITLSALQELEELHKKGFNIRITEATDGTEVIIAKNKSGLSRMFTIFNVKEETWEDVEMELQGTAQQPQ